MRVNPTLAERRLWSMLRDRRMPVAKFRRQHVIAPYIVDFASKAAKLIIEVDGDTHSDEDRYDPRRTAYLESLSYRVIRFGNSDVLGNIEGVLDMISQALRISPSPHPSPRGGREL